MSDLNNCEIALYLRKRVVVVNTFLIYSVDAVPSDSLVVLEVPRNCAYHVLDKDWIIVGLHCNVAFIISLQESIDWR